MGKELLLLLYKKLLEISIHKSALGVGMVYIIVNSAKTKNP